MTAQLVWESRVLPLTRSKLITANDKMHWAACSCTRTPRRKRASNGWRNRHHCHR